MNILDKAFRLLPKSIQSTFLIEELKRVDGYHKYHKSSARVFEERSFEIRTRLREIGEDV